MPIKFIEITVSPSSEKSVWSNVLSSITTYINNETSVSISDNIILTEDNEVTNIGNLTELPKPVNIGQHDIYKYTMMNGGIHLRLINNYMRKSPDIRISNLINLGITSFYTNGYYIKNVQYSDIYVPDTKDETIDSIFEFMHIKSSLSSPQYICVYDDKYLNRKQVHDIILLHFHYRNNNDLSLIFENAV